MFMTLQTLNSQQKLRQRILESLKEIITDKSYYNLFFKDTYIYAVDGNRIIVCCDNNVSLIVFVARGFPLVLFIVIKTLYDEIIPVISCFGLCLYRFCR